MGSSLIVANWKMNGFYDFIIDFCADLHSGMEEMKVSTCPEIVICPAALHISLAIRLLEHSVITVGAQDCHTGISGAHTGNISATMLKDAGCSHVILGHSERRQQHKEDDALIRAKVSAAHLAGVRAIICVGETKEERANGQAKGVVCEQLENGLPETAYYHNTVIAYEPVWAIGTGQTASVEEVQDMHRHIRAHIADMKGEEQGKAMKILYGGSMTPDNAAALLASPDIDGGLIGGASLSAKKFLDIISAAPDMTPNP